MINRYRYLVFVILSSENGSNQFMHCQFSFFNYWLPRAKFENLKWTFFHIEMNISTLIMCSRYEFISCLTCCLVWMTKTNNRCAMISAPVCGNVDCKNNHGVMSAFDIAGFLSITPQFCLQNNQACSLQIQDSNNAEVLLDNGLKLSDIIVTLCSKLLDYILLKSGTKY